MNPQIQKVTDYVETHLDDMFDLTHLAKLAGYSPYHFCRVFKLHIGESVMSYATRLRLERAAAQLSFENSSMIEVALDAGYQTPTGFLKAFKTRFNTTPTDFKKGMQVLFTEYKGLEMNKAEIVKREVAHVVYTRELGNYEKSSEVAWKKLSEAMHNLENVFAKNPPSIEMNLGEGNGEALGICHDDPKETDKENVRYDAALAWTESEVKELGKYGFETKSIAGGRYAKTTYTGGEEASEDAWYGLYAWVEKNGYTFRDEPAFEKYINAWNETDTSKIETEVYVPIV